MLLKKKDFCSALMKVSLPVIQYAGKSQAAGGSALFLPSYLGCSISESGELRAANIVGGIK